MLAHDQVGLPVLWFWPNVDAGSDQISKGLRRFRETGSSSTIYFFKNMIPDDFLHLLVGARCLIGNSSVGIREASYLGVPVVNIGNRQQGRDRAKNVIDVGYSSAEIVAAVQKHLSNGRYASSPLYGDGKAGERIALRIKAADNEPALTSLQALDHQQSTGESQRQKKHSSEPQRKQPGHRSRPW